MKNIISFLSAVLIAMACSLTLHSCSETSASHDSAEVAEEKNDEKFETREGEKNADLVATSVEYTYAVIELSKIAEEKAVREDVKNIAKDIKKDHEMILTDLKVVAEKEGISIANGPSDKAEDRIEDLSEKDADKFDKKYIDKMIEKHKKGIEELEQALKKDDIHEVEKEWANKTLPGLREHLQKLEAIEKDIKA